MSSKQKSKPDKLQRFLSILYAMLIESDNHYSDINQVIEKVSRDHKLDIKSEKSLRDINISSLRDFTNSNITTNAVSASLFSYMHATFEKYMMSLVNDSITSNTKLKNAYTNKIKSTAKRDDFRHLIDYLDSPKKRLSRLNDVSRSTNGIINLSKDLLSMTGIEIGGDIFEYAYTEYIECRETNNILKHRNDIYDKEYVDRVIKSSKQISKKVKVNQLFSHVKLKGTRKSCTVENIVGQEVSITPIIFIRAFRCIIYLASYFIKHFSNSEDKGNSDINHIAHSLMYLCKDIQHGADIELLKLSSSISSLVEDYNGITFNNILSTAKHIQILEDRYFTKQKKKLNEKSRETIQHVLDKDLSRIKKLKFNRAKTIKENKLLDEYYQKMLELYCLREKDEMIEFVFKHDVISASEFQSWAIFTEFHNNDIFLKKFKKKFKTKFESFSSISNL